jgi:predicted Zn-dependent peptidase
VERVIKSRDDARKNLNSIRFAMEDYGINGADNPTRYFLTADELKSTAPSSLTETVKGIFSYPHMISYYGPSDIAKVKEILARYHKVPETLAQVPEEKKFTYTLNKKPVVYVVDYDISQANISILFNDILFKKEIIPEASIFNNFFGPIVFQEIREAKGLAYTAYGSYRTPMFADQMTRFSAFMSTQADKLASATSGMKELMVKMPGDEAFFKRSNEGLLSSISTQRVTNSALFSTWYSNNLLGIDTDYRKLTFERAGNITLDEMKSFFDKHIASGIPSYLILGNIKLLDKKTLASLGEVKILKLEDVFGY